MLLCIYHGIPKLQAAYQSVTDGIEGAGCYDAPQVVLVEDNPHDIEITLRAFRDHFDLQKILILKNGEEAVSYMERLSREAAQTGHAHFPKLILLDIKLPLIDGLEVLGRIKGDPEIRKIPVVMLSSSREEKDIQESYELGANSYLVKPISFNEFKQVSRLLSPYWIKMNQVPFGPCYEDTGS